MPKGKAWRYSEFEIIKSNANTKTITELCELLPGRSKKAIYRVIEKLREDGKVGYKTREAVSRSTARYIKQKVEGRGVSSPDSIDWGTSDWGGSYSWGTPKEENNEESTELDEVKKEDKE